LAQFNLSVAYHRGEGVPKDDAEAMRWCQKAKDQGNKEAEKLLEELTEAEATRP
jgi:TPR repeat protein